MVDYAGDGLSLVSLEPPHHVRRVEGLAAPHNIVFAPDGRRLYISNLGSDRLSVVDVVRGRVLEELPMPFEGVTDLALTPDGRHALVLFSGRDEALMLDLASHRTMALLMLGACTFPRLSDDGGRAHDRAQQWRRHHLDRLLRDGRGDGQARGGGRHDGSRARPGSTVWPSCRAARSTASSSSISTRSGCSRPSPCPAARVTPALEPLGRKLYVPLVDRGALAVVDAAERRLVGLVEGVGEAPWERAAGRQPHLLPLTACNMVGRRSAGAVLAPSARCTLRRRPRRLLPRPPPLLAAAWRGGRR